MAVDLISPKELMFQLHFGKECSGKCLLLFIALQRPNVSVHSRRANVHAGPSSLNVNNTSCTSNLELRVKVLPFRTKLSS